MPLKKDREYRNLVKPLEVRSLADGEDNTAKVVEGYATTFDEPYMLYSFRDWDGTLVEVWEQVDAKAFEETDMDDVIMQYDHEGRVFARKSNGTLELNADEHGLHVLANLGGTETGRQLYEEINGGYTNKMSFGFTVKEDSRTETEDHENNTIKVMRTITKIGKLYDVSAVSLPANDGTEISSRNQSEGVIAEVMEEFQKRHEINIERQRMLLKIKSMEV